MWRGVGKGVVAAAFGLTTLIDDRAECLGSFYCPSNVDIADIREASKAVPKTKAFAN